jgi:hypothetical protein
MEREEVRNEDRRWKWRKEKEKRTNKNKSKMWATEL